MRAHNRTIEQIVADVRAMYSGQPLKELSPHDADVLAICQALEVKQRQVINLEGEVRTYSKVLDQIIAGLVR